jgi:hypothetical protein
MDNFNFWHKWLLATSIILITFGLGVAFFNQSSVFNQTFNNQINPAFWGHSQIEGTITHFQGWVYGVLGATVAGWGVMVFFIIQYPFINRQRWAWTACALSIGVWYAVDTWISLAFGVYFNALFNTLLLLLFALPLIFTRSHFNEHQ